MPELPEVETVRRGLAPAMLGARPAMLGARIEKVELRRADIRFPFPDSFAKRLTRRRIIEVNRRAKYLLFQLDSGETLIAHLGMSGSFRMERTAASIPGKFHHERSKDPKHDHVVLVLDNGWVVTYNDPRRFGFMDLAPTEALDQHPRMRGLGAEPLAPEFDAHCLAKLFAGSRTSLKAGLLDQKRIAGLGNIYVSEVLFRAGLSPSRPASILANARGAPTKAAAAVAKAIRDVLEEAVEAGGSTLRDHRQANGELGYFQHVFKVYDREGLRCVRERCRGIVARITQSGRSTFYCSKCQH
jgi:formamidopyrimidine-DNA glycosylase